MKRGDRIAITILVSLGMHLVLIVALVMPGADFLTRLRQKNDSPLTGRDIIVNTNQDDRKESSKRTLLSDRDSAEKGFLTEKRGDRWLNNSRDFSLVPGEPVEKQSSTGGGGENTPSARDSEVHVTIGEHERSAREAQKRYGSRIAIPDRNNITKENAIFYSSSGLFSFNTQKFKNFDYFRRMKDRIAANWFPPNMANSYIFGYAPGRTRIMAIPSQYVKVFFTLDRSGAVQDVLLIDSLGNRPLDESCIESIRNSKSFGPVPPDVEGDIIGIRFIFGYIVE